MVLISHSEAEAFTQCQKKHEYAHMQKITPRSHSMALTRGTTGHLILENFFQQIREDVPLQEAAKKAVTGKHLEGVEYRTLIEALKLTKPWMTEVFPTLGWKLVAIEREFRVPVVEGLIYPFKPDLIVQTKDGLAVVDHKYAYDPYPEDVVAILPQIPRYIGGLRSIGIPVEYGIYNFLRTRYLKDPMDAYVQTEVRPNDTRIRNSLDELVRTMEEIEHHKLNQIPGLRSANKMNCSNCGFVKLCKAELAGESTKIMRKADFVHNTYGYSEEGQ